MTPSLLTGMASPWQPDTPCPLAPALSVLLISGCPSGPSARLPPLSNPAYCYFDPVPSSLHIASSFHKICLTSSFVIQASRRCPIVDIGYGLALTLF